MMKAILALGVGVALAACGSGGIAGSCTTMVAMSMTCTEYGQGYTASSVMMACSGVSQTYSAGACPTANRVGRCTITATSSGNTASAVLSSYAPVTTDQVNDAEGRAILDRNADVDGRFVGEIAVRHESIRLHGLSEL